MCVLCVVCKHTDHFFPNQWNRSVWEIVHSHRPMQWRHLSPEHISNLFISDAHAWIYRRTLSHPKQKEWRGKRRRGMNMEMQVFSHKLNVNFILYCRLDSSPSSSSSSSSTPFDTLPQPQQCHYMGKKRGWNTKVQVNHYINAILVSIRESIVFFVKTLDIL